MPTVLIADDNRQITSVLEEYAKKEGYSPVVAFDGREALDQFSRVRPDVVLLDVMMPKIDGFEVCGQSGRPPTAGHHEHGRGRGLRAEQGSGYRRGRLLRKTLFPRGGHGADPRRHAAHWPGRHPWPPGLFPVQPHIIRTSTSSRSEASRSLLTRMKPRSSGPATTGTRFPPATTC